MIPTQCPESGADCDCRPRGLCTIIVSLRAQFAVPLPLRSRLAPSFESQTLPTLAHPMGGGSSCHKGIWTQSSPYFWSTRLALDKHLLPKCKKKKKTPKNKNSPRDFGGNHGNCLLSRITVTFSKSSLFHQLWDTLKFTECGFIIPRS